MTARATGAGAPGSNPDCLGARLPRRAIKDARPAMEDFLELMNHGYGAMWVVLGFSIIAIAVAIERLIAQWKFVTRARLLGDTVTRCLSRGAVEESRSACERSPSPIADVFLVGYERLGRARPEHVITAVHRERMRVNQAGAGATTFSCFGPDAQAHTKTVAHAMRAIRWIIALVPAISPHGNRSALHLQP
jgi:hypothetical protein